MQDLTLIKLQIQGISFYALVTPEEFQAVKGVTKASFEITWEDSNGNPYLVSELRRLAKASTKQT